MSPENQGVNKPKLHSVMTYGPCDNVTNGLETYKDQKSNHWWKQTFRKKCHTVRKTSAVWKENRDSQSGRDGADRSTAVLEVRSTAEILLKTNDQKPAF